MIQLGATSTWETWEPSGGTHSHVFGTTPVSAVVRGLMGVTPLLPTYAHFLVRPQVGHGNFSASLRRVQHDIKLPPSSSPWGSIQTAALPTTRAVRQRQYSRGHGGGVVRRGTTAVRDVLDE